MKFSLKNFRLFPAYLCERKVRVIALALVTITMLTACPWDSDNFPDRIYPWLSMKYSCPNCNNSEDLTTVTETINYYANFVGPRNLDGSYNYNFSAWKSENGFSTGGEEIRAIYANLYDLRMGRDMHCTQQGQKIACYVTNYGPYPYDRFQPYVTKPEFDFPHVTSAIEDAINQVNSFATVAMVYDGTSGPNNVTFYVFDTGGNLQPNAGLDPIDKAVFTADPIHPVLKTVPRMCMACHGGTYHGGNGEHYVTGASFLPFDVFAFQYSNTPGYTFDDQQEAFRRLNALVKATHPNPPIVNQINSWYAGGVENPGVQAVDSVPSAWSDNPKLYNLVVKPYCRMCHMAEDVSFSSYEEFQADRSNIRDYVCDKGIMPHAFVPYVRFWQKDYPALQEFRNFVSSECPSTHSFDP